RLSAGQSSGEKVEAMSEKSYTLALFSDFREAALAIAALRESRIKGFKMTDVILKSPIEHPECAAELGYRPVYNVNISGDKIGLLVKSDLAAAAAIKDIFLRHHALEVSSSP